MPEESKPRGTGAAVAGAWGAMALLLAMNLFNYIDRQVLAAVEPEIRDNLLPGESERDDEDRAAFRRLSGFLHARRPCVRLARGKMVAVAAGRPGHCPMEPGQRGERVGDDLRRPAGDALPGGRRRGGLRPGGPGDHRRLLPLGPSRPGPFLVLHRPARRRRPGLRPWRIYGRHQSLQHKVGAGPFTPS